MLTFFSSTVCLPANKNVKACPHYWCLHLLTHTKIFSLTLQSLEKHLENALLIHLNWDETSNLHYIQGNYTLWCCRDLENYINKYSLSMVIGTVAFDCSLRTTVHKLLHLSDSPKQHRHEVWMVQTSLIINNFFQQEKREGSRREKG